MKLADRVVTALPLRELWDEAGPIAGQRGAFIDREGIRAMLRTAPLRFVVADCGHPLRWVTHEACWSFWKNEVRDRVCPDGPIDLDGFSAGYCYAASIWGLATGERVVVLETHHRSGNGKSGALRPVRLPEQQASLRREEGKRCRKWSLPLVSVAFRTSSAN